MLLYSAVDGVIRTGKLEAPSVSRWQLLVKEGGRESVDGIIMASTDAAAASLSHSIRVDTTCVK
jgi:hypothetical protein